jgi:hypothetical protein
MAFVDVAAAVGTAVGADALGTAGATIAGGALLGGGAGALYGGLTGGNVLQDALYGAGIGGLGAGALGLAGAGAPAIDTAFGVGATPVASATAPVAGATGAGPAATAFANPVGNTALGAGYTGSTLGGTLNGLGSGTVVDTSATLGGTAYGGGTATAGSSLLGSGVPAAPTPGLASGMGMGKALLYGTGIVAGANLLGLNKPTTFTTPNQPAPMDTGYYKLNPATFQPNRPPINTNPVQPGIAQPYVYPNYVQNPYQPQQMASGGIASYKDSNYQDLKNQQEELQYFESMIAPKQTATQDPSFVSSPGIYQDIDPNTKYLSPYDAARYRQAQVMAAAGMPTSSGIGLTQKAVPYGTINTDPYMVQQAQQAAQQAQQVQGAAQGGIMGYNLGGYAHGGNPRLLDGPGDGMSDDIPATIGGTQPARLADGEFVVPADVVSHLGNGSTKAGAEKLHHMMDKVRMAKTGKKKQAPQLKTDKFIPT